MVKAFNTVFASRWAAPTENGESLDLYIAGDDAAAKATVTAVIDSFGYDVVDAGPLSEGWRFQRDTPAYLPRLDTAGLTAALAEAKRVNAAYAVLSQARCGGR